MTNKVALIIGAGDAIGSAIVRKFSERGLTVCATRRNGDKLTPLINEIKATGRKAHAFACDARNEESTKELFAKIENEIGEIEVVVFNIGANMPMGILETDSRKFFKIWEMACFAGFLNGREAAHYMSKRQRGTIILPEQLLVFVVPQGLLPSLVLNRGYERSLKVWPESSAHKIFILHTSLLTLQWILNGSETIFLITNNVKKLTAL